MLFRDHAIFLRDCATSNVWGKEEKRITEDNSRRRLRGGEKNYSEVIEALECESPQRRYSGMNIGMGEKLYSVFTVTIVIND